MNLVQQLDVYLGKILKYALLIIVNSVVMLMVLQIILRYFLHMPMKSIEELLVIPVIYLYFLGTINATRTDNHISARLLDVFCKTERQIAILRLISAILAIIVSGWFVYLSCDLLNYSLRMGKSSMILGYPMLLIEILPLISFLLMFFYYVAEVYKYLNIVRVKS